MKYWLLTTEYPPMHGGGISTYSHFTARMFAEAGHSVTVFVSAQGIHSTEITTQNNLRVIRFSRYYAKTQRFLGAIASMSYSFAHMVLDTLAQEEKPDIIEAQDYLGIAYYLTQYKHLGYDQLRGIPLLVTLHSPAFLYLPANRVPFFRYPDFWTGEMEKQSIQAADGLISPSRYLLDLVMPAITEFKKPVAVISNPFIPAAEKPCRLTRNKIVYVGKLSAQKGSFELLDYFKNLWDNGFEHPLHVVGETNIFFHPERKTMRHIVYEKYDGYIRAKLLILHGPKPPDQIDQCLADAHFVIVPSILDNQPYVVTESMHCGKIVLASRQGGQAEMIRDGENGFLFDHTEPASFYRAVEKILAMDDNALSTISRNAKQTVQNDYAPEKILQQKMTFFTAVREAPAQTHFPFLHQRNQMHIPERESIAGLLSVVIPYYNMGAYIDECLQSLQQSTYSHMEIIIFDDESTDRLSLEKLESLSKNKDVRILRQENKGVAKTRNNGAFQARGEYLSFIDADDRVEPTYFEKAIRALQKPNVYFVGAWVQYFENSQQIWPTFTPQPPYILVHNSVNSSGLVYKRDAFLQAGLQDYKTGFGLEDYESVVHMLSRGMNGVVLPEVLFYYRVRNGSMIRNVTKEKLLLSNAYIAEKHREYLAEFAAPVANLLNANGPAYAYDNPTFEVRTGSQHSVRNQAITHLKQFAKGNRHLRRLALYFINHNLFK